ncbi:putative ORFan [Tupanvirus deep ocean]|uniref:ORFan n=2 Tax=Tupanvirus TaxID=2094720 RepID=A0AC62A9R2_9VIRU|nr:putative ORFan [Tupanvirus deep ocean]QKU34444.1 putative ORFan [Tupanvirus deep ocean]
MLIIMLVPEGLLLSESSDELTKEVPLSNLHQQIRKGVALLGTRWATPFQIGLLLSK